MGNSELAVYEVTGLSIEAVDLLGTGHTITASRQNAVGTNVGMADCSEKRGTLRHCLVSRHSPDCFKILRIIVRNALETRV
jgi:hypothetical protein